MIIWEGLLSKKQDTYLRRWQTQDISSMENLYSYSLNYFTDQASYQVFLQRYVQRS